MYLFMITSASPNVKKYFKLLANSKTKEKQNYSSVYSENSYENIFYLDGTYEISFSVYNALMVWDRVIFWCVPLSDLNKK